MSQKIHKDLRQISKSKKRKETTVPNLDFIKDMLDQQKSMLREIKKLINFGKLPSKEEISEIVKSFQEQPKQVELETEKLLINLKGLVETFKPQLEQQQKLALDIKELAVEIKARQDFS